jgi:AcrR family transcriptional regulator
MCFTGTMRSMGDAARGVRARAREEMRQAILAAARARLATDGGPGLSLRAVARDVGLSSSAVYRYFSSRDELLTALIIGAYDSLGEAVERTEAAVDRADFPGRWRAWGHAARAWAVANPHEWALIFGSPIPGYAAPHDTIPAAARAPMVLVGLLADAATVGALRHQWALPGDGEASVAPLLLVVPPTVGSEAAARGLMAWTYVLGSISAQLFGHRINVVADDGADAFYEIELDRVAELVGMLDVPPGAPPAA